MMLLELNHEEKRGIHSFKQKFGLRYAMIIFLFSRLYIHLFYFQYPLYKVKKRSLILEGPS